MLAKGMSRGCCACANRSAGDGTPHTCFSRWHVHLALAAVSAVSIVDNRNIQDLGRSISDTTGSMSELY